jgi:hypothetical protein
MIKKPLCGNPLQIRFLGRIGVAPGCSWQGRTAAVNCAAPGGNFREIPAMTVKKPHEGRHYF